MSKIALPQNSREYDDEAYANASTELVSAVADLWDAGATQEDIEREFRNALQNIAS